MKKLNERQKRLVKEVLSDKLGVDFSEIKDDSELTCDLGMDSLDAIELIIEFEAIFNIRISDDNAEEVNKVSDIYECLEKSN